MQIRFLALVFAGCTATASPPASDADGGRPDAAAHVPLDSSMAAPAEVPPAVGIVGPPTRDHGVVERTCPRRLYGPGWALVPTATDCGPKCRTGTACARNEDCRAAPFGECIGIADGICEYQAVSEQPERCAADTDCVRGPGASCLKEIRFTFCLYDDCQVDADCPGGQACQCGSEAADPWCVTLGCDSAVDCDPNQECRVDESYVGVFPQRHCSTARDSCATNADCQGSSDDSCGFDDKDKRWLCRPFVIVD